VPQPSSSADDSPGLPRRELEILRLVAEGHSNAQLARMLWVTEQTIKFHLSNIYRKLDVANRTEASRWAQVHGLLEARQAATLAPALAS
jgi:DNA-binding CsgD family transcriptional regulator